VRPRRPSARRAERLIRDPELAHRPVITESHVSVHAFPARGFVGIDVYTCRNGLDRALIERYVAETFRLTDLEVRFLRRGTRYPTSDLHPAFSTRRTLEQASASTCSSLRPGRWCGRRVPPCRSPSAPVYSRWRR